MSKEIAILISAWIIMIILLLLYVPRNKIREAYVIFFFKQLLTWFLGLTVAELRLIEYPVREFPYASKTSFSFEFFLYPSICILFNLHFPKTKNMIVRFMHYFWFCTAITIVEVAIERYTDIIKYVHWEWYTTWITLFITFYASRKYYIWFFKLKSSDKSNA